MPDTAGEFDVPVIFLVVGRPSAGGWGEKGPLGKASGGRAGWVGEFASSIKYGSEQLRVKCARYADIKPDTRYLVTIEAWPEANQDGRHARYRIRMKWRADGEPERYDWIEVTDTAGAPLPEAEYAIALISYYAQAEFGPVTVLPLEAPSRADAGRSPP